MASNIDPTLNGATTTDGARIAKGDLQNAFQTAKDEIEELQEGGGGVGSSSFVALSDTPSTYSANKRKVLRVSDSETSTEFSEMVGHPFPGTLAKGNADYAIVATADAQVIHFNTTLTASRTVTLPTANIFIGLSYWIKRTGGGEDALVVDGLGSGGGSSFNLYENECLYCYHDGTSWEVLLFGHLDRSIDMRDSELKSAKAGSFTSVVGTPSISSGTITLDCATASVFAVSLTENVTSIALTNVDASVDTDIRLRLTQDGTGGRTVAWSVTVNGSAVTERFDRGSPTVSSSANAEDSYVMRLISGDLTKVNILTEYQDIAA